MDKQKQIKEMANIIHRTEFVDISGYEEEKIAEELLKHYQPKIHENAVVLTREEWDKYQTTNRDWNAIYFEGIEKARKETAEKFAEKLKARFSKSREYYEVDTGTAWSDGHIGGLINDTIDEIAKEFTEGKI